MAGKPKQPIWTGDERYYWPRARTLAAARRPSGEAIRGMTARWVPRWQAYSLLKPHPLAYRVHTGEEIEAIAESLRMVGCVKAVVCAAEETVLCGWAVVLAARYLGMARLPVLSLPIEPESEAALALLFLDNEIPRLAWSESGPRTRLLAESGLLAALEGGNLSILAEDDAHDE